LLPWLGRAVVDCGKRGGDRKGHFFGAGSAAAGERCREAARKEAMKRTWPIIAVRDVQLSSKWYQALLACPNTHSDSVVFDQIVDADGTVLVCLHHWGDHGHPSLTSPQGAEPGNGLLLFFRVDDFDLAWERARRLAPAVEEESHINMNTGTMEFSLRDPDGYYVTINAA
jgi:hypothetical protein